MRSSGDATVTPQLRRPDSTASHSIWNHACVIRRIRGSQTSWAGSLTQLSRVKSGSTKPDRSIAVATPAIGSGRLRWNHLRGSVVGVVAVNVARRQRG